MVSDRDTEGQPKGRSDYPSGPHPPVHRIRRLRLAASINGSSAQQAGLELRTLLHQSTTDISNCLSDALDRVERETNLSATISPQAMDNPASTTGRYLYLPKINLAIQITERELQSQNKLLQAIRHQLLPQLREQLDQHLIADHKPQPSTRLNESWLRSPQSGTNEDFETTQTLSRQQLNETSLLYYLQRGYLPWYYPEANIAKTNWHQLLQDPDWLGQHLEQLEHFDAWARLLHLIEQSSTPPTWSRFFLSLALNKQMTHLLNEVQALIDKQELITTQQGLLIMAALIATNKQLPRPTTPQNPLSFDQIEQIRHQLKLKSALWGQFQQSLANYGLWISSSQQTELAASQPKDDLFLTDSKHRANGLTDNWATQSEPSSLSVSFAGLILLYPYLPHLFSRLNWLNDNHQLEQQHLGTMAKALAYLATGDTNLPEYQLVWIKRLLDLDPDSLLLLDERDLDAELIDELDQLLDSLVSHWRALKNTSKDGLRQTFLQRPGLLRRKDDHWQLYLERQGVDVLIDQLPFSISTVKLLWMQRPIHVNW